MKTFRIMGIAMLAAFSVLAHQPATAAHNDRIHINVSVVNYPSATEQSTCRLKFQAVNDSARRVELSALVRIFDAARAGSGAWQVPTGMMEPGQAVERTYTCKEATFIRLDARNHYGWPGKCIVDGAFKAPCPMDVNVKFNLPELRVKR